MKLSCFRTPLYLSRIKLISVFGNWLRLKRQLKYFFFLFLSPTESLFMDGSLHSYCYKILNVMHGEIGENWFMSSEV